MAKNVYQGLAMGIFPVICKHRKRFYVLEEDSGLRSKTVLRPPSEGFSMLYVIKVHCVLKLVLLFISKQLLGWNR